MQAHPSESTSSPAQAQPPLVFPALPPELALHILIFACHTSHDTALSISLVSSWVRSTVLPFVFSTIVRRAGPAPLPSWTPSLLPTVPSSVLSLLPGRQDARQPPTGSVSGWTTPHPHPYPNPSLARQRSSNSSSMYAHLLPPTTRDVGGYVRHLWIESIDMMSSPGELGIFNACANIEDVALTAGSLRLLYNLTFFGKKKVLPLSCQGGGTSSSAPAAAAVDAEADPDEPEREVHTVGAASRIRSVTLTKHTFRYDWHFLVNIHTSSHHTHASLLANITHLRMTTLEKSAYVPVDYLANLTHLALPYLELRPFHRSDVVRVPDVVLQAQRMIVVGTEDDSPTAAPQRALTPSRLRVVVLTVDEGRWLSEPWQYGAHVKEDSPRQLFKDLRRRARERDQRIRVVLSPRMGRDVCSEWAGAARGNEDSVWEVAEKMGEREEYANILPVAFPRLST